MKVHLLLTLYRFFCISSLKIAKILQFLAASYRTWLKIGNSTFIQSNHNHEEEQIAKLCYLFQFQIFPSLEKFHQKLIIIAHSLCRVVWALQMSINKTRLSSNFVIKI